MEPAVRREVVRRHVEPRHERALTQADELDPEARDDSAPRHLAQRLEVAVRQFRRAPS
jgi:hypothetical protein